VETKSHVTLAQSQSYVPSDSPSIKLLASPVPLPTYHAAQHAQPTDISHLTKLLVKFVESVHQPVPTHPIKQLVSPDTIYQEVNV